MLSKIKGLIEKIGKKIKPVKKDPLVATHHCPYNLTDGKKCKGTIFENTKLDFQLKGECGKTCPFMAEYFAMVYIAPPERIKIK